MNCAYHSIHVATVHCISCGRAICAACDHRIKGNPHCQDCIVAGIDLLRRGAGGQRVASREEKSPFLALLLGVIPGLGAAYNGQNIKALVHFAAAVGLMTFSDIFPWPLEVVFGLGGFAFYCYSIHDAYASAQRKRNGEDLATEDERLKSFLRQRPQVWGLMLIALGGLAAINIAFPHILRNFWPLLLIVAGLFFLRNYQGARKEPELKTAYRTPPPSVIPPAYDRTTNDFARYDR